MQDIIFYVAPCGTRGVVRDSRNVQNAVPPTITRGIPVRLHMRLFSDRYSDAPYPPEAFTDVAAWRWIMDDDWDRGTICKLAGDGASISIRTVANTVNGAAVEFTEFVIPLYNTDTDLLRAWLGRDPIKAGLQGELIGLDSAGDPVFVLQIENFSVRNRVSAAAICGGEDIHGVTREQVAGMIQSALSGLNVSSGGSGGSTSSGTGSSSYPAPTVPSVTHSPTSVTNGNVTMTAISDSSAVSIFYRQGASGNYTSTSGSSATVSATSNGTWYFYATNNVNTQSPVVSHTISNIDKTPPDIRLWAYDSSTTLAETYCSASAYNEPNLPIYWMYSENGVTYGASSSYNPALPLARNGYYKYFATDAAGNTGEAILHLTNLVTDEERD